MAKYKSNTDGESHVRDAEERIRETERLVKQLAQRQLALFGTDVISAYLKTSALWFGAVKAQLGVVEQFMLETCGVLAKYSEDIEEEADEVERAEHERPEHEREPQPQRFGRDNPATSGHATGGTGPTRAG